MEWAFKSPKMRIAVFLLCAAVAAASYVPASHHQDHAKWNDETSAKHDFNKGNHDKKTSGFKDNKSGHVQGGQNFNHREHYTATKHNIVKDKHVVNHNSDDNKAITNHNAYGKGYGDSYQVGGSQKHSDSGKNGHLDHHQTSHHDNHGYHGYPAYGYHGAHGAYGAHGVHGHNKANQAKHSQADNAWASHGASASNKHGAHQAHVNGYGNNGDAYDRYVKHQEVHTHEDEDFATKDVLQEANRHSNFQKADQTHADKGSVHSAYDHAAGHDSQWKASHGHKDSDKHGHGHGKHGDHGDHHDSASQAAGKSHQDHDSKNGGIHQSHDNAADKHGSSYNTHDNKKNVYNVKTRKVHKTESVINHSDGFSKDNIGDFKFGQGKYGVDSDWYKTNKDSKKDNSYNNYNNQYASQYYQPTHFGHFFG